MRQSAGATDQVEVFSRKTSKGGQNSLAMRSVVTGEKVKTVIEAHVLKIELTSNGLPIKDFKAD